MNTKQFEYAKRAAERITGRDWSDDEFAGLLNSSFNGSPEFYLAIVTLYDIEDNRKKLKNDMAILVAISLFVLAIIVMLVYFIVT